MMAQIHATMPTSSHRDEADTEFRVGCVVFGRTNGANNRHLCDFRYRHMIPRNIQVARTFLTIGRAVVEDTMSMAIWQEYLIVGNVNVPKVVSVIAGLGQWNPDWATTAAAGLEHHRERTDISYIFMVGTLLTIMLADLEAANIVPIFAAAQDDIVSINFNLAPTPCTQIIFANATAIGRQFLRYSSFTASQRNCLRILCRGTDGITTAAGENMHLYSTFVCERIKICFYEFHIMQDLPVVAATASQMWMTLLSLASHLRCPDMLVRGYVRACNYGYGTIRTDPGAENQLYWYYNSTLECGSFISPKPSGHNFLWKELNIEGVRPLAPMFETEYVHLTSMSIDQVVSVAPMVSQYITIGASAFFKEANITGREVAGYYIPGVANHCSAYLQKFFVSKPNDKMMAKFFNIAAGWASQLTDMVMNPMCIACTEWSNGATKLRDVCDEGLHWVHFGLQTPHIIQPEVSSYMLKKWPVVWGIISPGTTFNVTHELATYNRPMKQGWYSLTDTTEFTANITSGVACKNICYPLCALTAMRQDASELLPWQTHYRAWNTTFLNTTPTEIVVADPVIEFHPVLLFARAYSVRTYDWERQVVLEMVVTADDLGTNYWNIIKHSGIISSPSIGIDLPRSPFPYCLKMGTEWEALMIRGAGDDMSTIAGANKKIGAGATKN
ncbi:unnamed protein product [Diamesa hyperborea]